MIKHIFLLLLAAIACLGGCESKPPAQLRAEHLAASSGDVVIAVAWPLSLGKASLINGVTLAADDINRHGGVLGGRKIKIVLKDDESSLTKGRLAAQEIVNDLDVTAVIGHLNTYVTLPASLIYERAGVLMITPGASGQKITEMGSKLVFRTLPNNREQGKQIGDYAAAQGYKSVAIYYIKNDYGIDLANYFEQRANELGIAIVDRRSYNMNGDNYSSVLADWSSLLKFDAIFLAGSMPESAQIIREARQAGIKVPIFGGVGLDSPQLIQMGGKDVEGTVVFSLFSPNDTRPEALAFDNKYRTRFGTLPDSSAAQGYDTLNVLVHAIEASRSIVPTDIAAALRTTRDWHGATGIHTFRDNGDVVSKQLVKVVVRKENFALFDSAVAQQ